MLELKTSRMQMLLHEPEDGFYQGTRFDRSGIWDSLMLDGVEFCGRWFSSYDPLMHDAVCGAAEEFSPFFLKEGILKIGVGLLSGEAEGYDRFKLYPVKDGGEWTVEADREKLIYRHRLAGYYSYAKEIAICGKSAFEIRHSLQGELPLEGEVYNHNFFTMGNLSVGPSRQMVFPFTPEGDWRASYDSVGFTPSGIRFSRPLSAGESVYAGNIHELHSEGMPYRLALKEGPLSVQISADVPCLRTVFWSNHRIACLEPYSAIGPSWTLKYELATSD